MRILLAATGLLLVAACGSETGAAPATDSDPVELLTTLWPATVLDDGDGAELCLGGVMESLPPQCSGPRVAGWDWSQHRGDFEAANGTRWGEFVLSGTFDGSTFTPSEVVGAAEWDGEYADDGRDFTSPCPEPEGGWRVLDPAMTTDATLERTMRVATGLDDYAESWVDQTINPLWDAPEGPDTEAGMNDPRHLVVNVRVTGDVEAAETALRESWGGALCVSRAEHTDAELARVQRALNDTPGMLSTSRGQDRVDLAVVHDDGTLQRSLDERYGAGVVRVASALVAVE